MRYLSNNKGTMVIVIAFFALLFISFLVIAFLDLFTIDTEIVRNHQWSDQALYLADAGIEEVRYLLEDDWTHWTSPLPSQPISNKLLGAGLFSAVISDDDDGDGDPNVDSNNTVIIDATGEVNNLWRRIKVEMKRGSKALDSAIYSSGSLSLTGEATTDGEVINDTGGIPGIDHDYYIAEAKANKLNGYSGPNGNYFVGDTAIGRSGSLNGVIYVDGNLELSGTRATDSTLDGYPATLIVTGNLTMWGEVIFEGLIYVVGNVDLKGEVELTGGLIVGGTVTVKGEVMVTYNSDYVLTEENTTHIMVAVPLILSWKEE